MIPLRRLALALLLSLALVGGVSALDGYANSQTVEYAACDQTVYQQDVVIHRTTGTAYEETVGGMNIWHLYVGEGCKSDYGDVRFTDSSGTELAYYLWPDYDSGSARVCVRLEGATSAGAVTVWYGSATATTTSDGDATFFIFDDFETGSTPDSDIWTWSGTPPAISNGQLVQTPGVSGLTSVASLGAPEVWVQYQYTGVNLGPNTGYSVYSILTTEPVSGIIFYPYSQYARRLAKNDAYSWWSSPLEGRGATRSTNIISVGLAVDRVIHQSKGTFTFTETSMGTTGVNAGQKLRVGPPDPSYNNAGNFDWLLVRAYSASPPAIISSAFTASPTTGHTPLTVQFTDTSTGGVTSWLWNFGDGQTSTLQNPSHTYTTTGTYTVSLMVSHAAVGDTKTKADLITVYEPGPYYVRTYADLCKVGTDRDGWTADAEYLQTADIQCPAGVSFTPIGEDDPFIGSYDGQGHVIRDLYINRPDDWDVGLFGLLEDGARVTNVTLEDFSITADGEIGGLVGYSEGEGVIIENCTVSGTISGGEDYIDYIGGLIGYAESATITDCHADVKILGEMIYAAGGLIGETYYCNVTSCSAQGDIAYADESGGGLIGYCYGSTITDCHAHGDVAIDPDARYQDGPNGGLVGYLRTSSAFNCSATGDVIGGDWATGGLVGYGRQSTVARCYASGNVSGYEHVGGLIGYYEPRAEYSLDDCYATGNVVSSGSSTDYCSAGGLIGLWDQYQLVLDGHIKNVYSAGSVSAPNLPAKAVGGLIGQIDSGTGVVATAAYWNTETSGQATSAGGATGKTTAELQTLATFADWSIATPAEYTDEVWFLVEGEDYPRLAWEGLPALPPTAAFSAAPTSGTAPLTVQFTDTSTNTPTSWSWTFGDGGTSTAQNPDHTYAAAGTYTVTLTATSPGGSDTETKAGYITVSAAPTPTTATPTVTTPTPTPTTPPSSSSAHALPYSEQRKDTMGFLLMCWGALPFVGVFCIVIFLLMNGSQRGSGGI